MLLLFLCFLLGTSRALPSGGKQFRNYVFVQVCYTLPARNNSTGTVIGVHFVHFSLMFHVIVLVREGPKRLGIRKNQRSFPVPNLTFPARRVFQVQRYTVPKT